MCSSTEEKLVLVHLFKVSASYTLFLFQGADLL